MDKEHKIILFIKGWDRCNAMDMNKFYHNIVSQEERNQVEDIEPFDEFEVRIVTLGRHWLNRFIHNFRGYTLFERT